MLPLAYVAILAGAVLMVAGVTGSSVSSAAQGKPDRSKAGEPSATVTGTTAQPSSSSPAPHPNTSSGSWRATQAAIASSKGWNLGDWNQVITKESGGDPNSRNASSGAYGLGQFLGSTAQAYAHLGALSPNPTLQIKAMAAYIQDRYGTPTAALAHEHAYGWY